MTNHLLQKIEHQLQGLRESLRNERYFGFGNIQRNTAFQVSALCPVFPQWSSGRLPLTPRISGGTTRLSA